jgi:hypothetical protein
MHTLHDLRLHIVLRVQDRHGASVSCKAAMERIVDAYSPAPAHVYHEAVHLYVQSIDL